MADPTAQPYVPPVWGPNMPTPAAVQPPRQGPNAFTVRHDNTIPLWTSWDVPTAMAAIDQHTLGAFWQSGQLLDAMGMDDSFDAVTQTRILGLVSRPFKLKPAKHPNRKLAKAVRDELAEKWDQIFPEDVLVSLMRNYLGLGFSPFQLIWRYDERRWMPTVQVWHGSSFWFDSSTRHYVANTMEGAVYLRPGDGQWGNLTPFGTYRGWLQGAVRSLIIPWLARQYAARDWARYNEVHGMPIKLAKAPANADAPDKQNFESAIANLGSETTILLPQGIDNRPDQSFDVELLEATADTWEAFQGIMDKCERRMAIRMLGQNLTTEVDAGSLAAANTHDRVRLDYVRFDAKAMSALREQVLKVWCQFNFGDGDLAPHMCWNVDPPNDKQQTAISLAQTAAAIANFRTSGIPVDERKLLKQQGIPTLPEGVAPPPPPMPASPGGTIEKPPALPPPEKREVARLNKAVKKQRGHANAAQDYVDGVVAKGAGRAAAAMQPHVTKVRDAITGAKDFDDLKTKLERIAHGADATSTANVMHRALLLAELAGRVAVRREHTKK
jgi:phage gp29-like protein